MTDNDFRPEMLTLARESRGYTQTRLAQETNLSPSLISRFESGMTVPSAENIAKLATALRYSETLFSQPDAICGLGCSFLFHRERQSIPVLAHKQIAATVNIIYMQIARFLKPVEITSVNSIEPRDLDQDGGPTRIAMMTRAAWKMPSGPVRSVVECIESAGGIVVHYPFKNRKADGLHLWPPGLPPLFFINSDMPGDRARLTLAHELGHAIMHRQPTQNIEDEAYEFASEFLMPDKEIKRELIGLTLEKAAALKPYWKVSMQALVTRAYTLGVIPQSRYRRLFTQISACGYKLREPLPISSEKPRSLNEIIRRHLQELSYTINDLSDLAFLPDRQEFCERYVPDHSQRLRIA